MEKRLIAADELRKLQEEERAIHLDIMRIFAILRIAMRAFVETKVLRTALTMLGIIIGVAAVIAMVSIGNGAKAQIEANIAAPGQNTHHVFSGNLRRGGFSMGFGSAGTLTKEDMRGDRARSSRRARDQPGSPRQRASRGGNQNLARRVHGVAASYPEFRNWTFTSGGPFSDQDVNRKRKSRSSAKPRRRQLFGDDDPVGQTIRIKNAPFTIVGLLNPKGSGFGRAGPGRCDHDSVDQRDDAPDWRHHFRNLSLQAVERRSTGRNQRQIASLLRQRHRLQDGQDDDFFIRTQTEIIESTSTAKTMTVLLGSIAGVSLLVGGIGIMNIMLVSVTERTREIGIRMAVGAKSGDILIAVSCGSSHLERCRRHYRNRNRIGDFAIDFRQDGLACPDVHRMLSPSHFYSARRSGFSSAFTRRERPRSSIPSSPCATSKRLSQRPLFPILTLWFAIGSLC